MLHKVAGACGAAAILLDVQWLLHKVAGACGAAAMLLDVQWLLHKVAGACGAAAMLLEDDVKALILEQLNCLEFLDTKFRRIVFSAKNERTFYFCVYENTAHIRLYGKQAGYVRLQALGASLTH